MLPIAEDRDSAAQKIRCPAVRPMALALLTCKSVRVQWLAPILRRLEPRAYVTEHFPFLLQRSIDLRIHSPAPVCRLREAEQHFVLFMDSAGNLFVDVISGKDVLLVVPRSHTLGTKAVEQAIGEHRIGMTVAD